MQYRPQRGGLDESMKEVVTLPASRRALAEHLGHQESAIIVKPYAGFYEDEVYDERICWNTYLVTVERQAVGFTDGPLES